MAYLPAAVLSLLAFPCLAETLEEQFSRMDLNKDGFLSAQEFVQGMEQKKTGIPYAAEATPMNQLSAAEKQKLVDEAVSEAKKMLTFKVDQATTWTDVYGGEAEINYVYRIEMDTSAMPAEQARLLRPVFENQICPKVKPGLCGVMDEVLFKNGVSLTTHYTDKNGGLLAECHFTHADCE